MITGGWSVFHSACRKTWLEYFQRTNDSITVAFWSANQESERLKQIAEATDLRGDSPSSIPDMESDQDTPTYTYTPHWIHNLSTVSHSPSPDGTEESCEVDVEGEATALANGATVSSDGGESSSEDEVEATICRDEQMDYADSSQCEQAVQTATGDDEARLLNGEELIDLLLSISPVKEGELTTVGMVIKCYIPSSLSYLPLPPLPSPPSPSPTFLSLKLLKLYFTLMLDIKLSLDFILCMTNVEHLWCF